MTNLILTAALKGTVVLAAAWLATALLRRRSADLRHRIWLAALIAMALFLLPVFVPQTLRLTIDAGAAVPGTALHRLRGDRYPRWRWFGPCWRHCSCCAGAPVSCGYFGSRARLDPPGRCA